MAPRQRYKGPGGESSIDKLKALGFDPIDALVEAYNEINAECKAQAEIRDKKLVRLRADGKAKAYDVDFHVACIERRSVIADKLMRYKYPRVPESNDLNLGGLPSLNINLHDSNEGFTINPQEEEIDEEE